MFQKQLRDVFRLITPQRALDYAKIRIGCDADGGYVQLDDFRGISQAVSLGIGTEVSWDLGIASRGIPVEQFDHTVEKSPTDHLLFKFNKQEATHQTLIDLTSKYQGDMLLKMDIDLAEWELFDKTPLSVLRRFSQIICEFHNIEDVRDEVFFNRMSRVFHKLYQQFVVVHVHGNNINNIVSLLNVPVPSMMEVTFANRNRYIFGPNTDTFPTDLDRPNAEGPDIWLGTFQF